MASPGYPQLTVDEHSEEGYEFKTNILPQGNVIMADAPDNHRTAQPANLLVMEQILDIMECPKDGVRMTVQASLRPSVVVNRTGLHSTDAKCRT